jgi:hypothetical protein
MTYKYTYLFINQNYSTGRMMKTTHNCRSRRRILSLLLGLLFFVAVARSSELDEGDISSGVSVPSPSASASASASAGTDGSDPVEKAADKTPEEGGGNGDSNNSGGNENATKNTNENDYASDGGGGGTATATAAAAADTCEAAKTCTECREIAKTAFAEAANHDDYTCAWIIGTGGAITCQTTPTSDVADPDADMCGGTTTVEGDKGGEGKPDTKDVTSPPAPGLVVPDDESSNRGAIFGVLLVMACAGAAFKKCKDKLRAKRGGGGLGGMTASSAKSKYHEV